MVVIRFGELKVDWNWDSFRKPKAPLFGFADRVAKPFTIVITSQDISDVQVGNRWGICL